MGSSIRVGLVFFLLLGMLPCSVWGTRLVSYQCRGREGLGAWLPEGVVDLHQAYRLLLEEQGKARAGQLARALMPPHLVSFLQGGEESMEALGRTLEWVRERLARGELSALLDQGALYRHQEVRLGPAVPDPPHLLAVGLNYRPHIGEMGRDVPAFPTLFSKHGRIIGDGETIVVPSGVEAPDYEGELAVVIGRPAFQVPESQALDYVAGYVVFNDVTARDWQDRVSQWTLGKSPDTFSAMGSFLVLKDEIPNPQNLGLRTRLGEEVVQEAHTSEMIFSVGAIISYISQVMTLTPGTVIATGTPAGVGNARTPPRYLQDGDVVVVEIERVGSLRNPVRRP